MSRNVSLQAMFGSRIGIQTSCVTEPRERFIENILNDLLLLRSEIRPPFVIVVLKVECGEGAVQPIVPVHFTEIDDVPQDVDRIATEILILELEELTSRHFLLTLANRIEDHPPLKAGKCHE